MRERETHQAVTVAGEPGGVRVTAYVSHPGANLMLGSALLSDDAAEKLHVELGQLLARRRARK